PPADPAGDERFRADLTEAGLGPLFVHAPYLVNFASASAVTRERSSESVAATLAKAASIGAAGVVVPPRTAPPAGARPRGRPGGGWPPPRPRAPPGGPRGVRPHAGAALASGRAGGL